MSLLVNSSGLEKDILLGGFKSVQHGKMGMAGYNVIFGRNSIGKTTILEALSFVIDLHNSTIANAAYQTTIEKFVLGSFNPFVKSTLELNNEKNAIAEKIRQQVINSHGEYFEHYKATLDEMFSNQFKMFAHSHAKPIEFYLDFLVDGKDEYTLSVEMEKAQIKSNLVSKVSRMAPDKKIIDAITFFLQNSIPSSSVFITNKNGRLIRNGVSRADVHDVRAVVGSLLELRKEFGQEKLLKLIQLADPNVQDIVFTESGENIAFNKIIVDGKNVDVFDLSTGTRQFIMVFDIISVKTSAYGSIRLIDEFELSLHKELVDVLKIVMNQMFEKYNVQYILTTHSPLAVQDYTSFKQIYSISLKGEKHVVERLSTKFKQHQSIVNRYLSGDLAPYPDSELSRNVAGDLIE